MARTRIFTLAAHALGAAASKAGRAAMNTPLTRRDALRLSAASTFLAANAVAKPKSLVSSEARIAIVGGGAAGLTAAYTLCEAGLSPSLFEAGNRWGGRMLTVPDFYHGIFGELGGEFVDTRHQDLRDLAETLGVAFERLFDESEADRDLLYFGGQWRTSSDMFNPQTGQGAFLPIAKRLAADKAALRDKTEAFTARARALDAVSLADYLHQFRGKAEDWAIDLLDVAYTIEFGLPIAEQSSLNLIDLIGVDEKQPFQIFGESDEAFRIKGGSNTLTDALVRACEAKAKLIQGAALTAISRHGRGFDLTFDGFGDAKPQTFDFVILALPFTRLRKVKGTEQLGLTPAKLKAIRDLGYGNNAKILCGTTSRVWRSKEASGLPGQSNGNFYGDLGFQNVWETSRGQPGDRGLFCNFLGGAGVTNDQTAAAERLKRNFSVMAPNIAEALDQDAVTGFFWKDHWLTEGSYASAKPGQYTQLLPVAAKPECGGRLLFAGEHTDPEFLGYMNGAVRSGKRAAKEALAAIAK